MFSANIGMNFLFNGSLLKLLVIFTNNVSSEAIQLISEKLGDNRLSWSVFMLVHVGQQLRHISGTYGNTC